MSLWSKYKTSPEDRHQLEEIKRIAEHQREEASWLLASARGLGDTFRHSRRRNNYGLIASDIIRGKRGDSHS